MPSHLLIGREVLLNTHAHLHDELEHLLLESLVVTPRVLLAVLQKFLETSNLIGQFLNLYLQLLQLLIDWELPFLGAGS